MTMSTAQMNSGFNLRNFSDKTTTMCLIGDNDEEVSALIFEESGAFAAVSKSNRTLARARQTVKDARAGRKPVPKSSAAASVHEAERTCSLSRGPHLARDCPDRKKHHGKCKKGHAKARKFMAIAKALAQCPWLRHSRFAARTKSEFINDDGSDFCVEFSGMEGFPSPWGLLNTLHHADLVSAPAGTGKVYPSALVFSNELHAVLCLDRRAHARGTAPPPPTLSL